MPRKLSAEDQIRLLCNAAGMIHDFETQQEVTSPRCKTPGELMLQDALVYLAYVLLLIVPPREKGARLPVSNHPKIISSSE